MSIQIEFNAKTDAFSAAVDKMISSTHDLGDAGAEAAAVFNSVGEASSLESVPAKIRKVRGEVDGVTQASEKAAAALAAWRKETGLSPQPTIGGSRFTPQSPGEINTVERPTGRGKTAADFAPATAEMRAASIAEEEVGKGAEKAAQSTSGLSAATRESGHSFTEAAAALGELFIAYQVANKAYEAFKYTVAQSAGLEDASVRFRNLAGNTALSAKAFEELKVVAKQTNTNIVDLGAGATTMLEAGIKMDDIPKVMKSIADKANVAGSSIAELSDIYLKAATRGEVGGRQLAMIDKLLGDQTGQLAAEYQDMTITIPRIATEMERVQKATERTRADADRLAERTTQDVNLVATRSTADLDKAITRATSDLDKLHSSQISFGEAHGGEGAFSRFAGRGPGKTGAGPSSRANTALLQEFREGVAQIGEEEGVDAMALVRSGQIKESEVVQAASRRREMRETQATRQREDTDLGASRVREDTGTDASRTRADAATRMQRGYEDATVALDKRKEAERLDLAAKAKAGILPSTDPEKIAAESQQRANVAATQAYNLKGIGEEIRDAAQNAGSGLKWLGDQIDALSKSVTGYDRAAHPVKGSELIPHSINRAPGGPRTDWEHLGHPQASAGAASAAAVSGDKSAASLAKIETHLRDLNSVMREAFA